MAEHWVAGMQAKPRQPRGVVGGLWWFTGDGGEPTSPAKSVRHVGQGTLGM